MGLLKNAVEKYKTAKIKLDLARAKKKELEEERSHLIYNAKKSMEKNSSNEANSEKKTEKKKTTTPIKSRAIISKFDKKKTVQKRRFSRFLEDFLEKAGIEKKPKEISKSVIFVSIILTFISIIAFIIYGLTNFLSSNAYFVFIPLIIILGSVFFYIASLITLFIYFDFKIYQRTGQIEDVLPDFLQLASANISAGMPIDRALWFAVRPRFGVLAKEMEEIAKATFTGSELDEALIKFTQKYKSRLLKESVNLIIAGLKSGGELGDLLNKISENIQQTKIMRKEISASVMTYVIFIGVASVLAAPLLFALSSQLLHVVTGISGDFDTSAMEDMPSGVMPISFNFGSGESVKQSDFKIFSFTLIVITSFFAAAIIGVIQKGNAKSALTKFPMFLVISLIIFYVSNKFLGILLGGLMG
ncbi:type II secretion system F family protein [Candidatus Woesearchaeota archaeon]|nr:type II secretion system F family protein [Candidatus Woesearchaeota archaeon]